MRRTAFGVMVVLVASVSVAWPYSLSQKVDGEALEDMAAGRYGQAITRLEKVLEALPESDAYWYRLTTKLAVCYEATGRFRKAAKEFENLSLHAYSYGPNRLCDSAGAARCALLAGEKEEIGGWAAVLGYDAEGVQPLSPYCADETRAVIPNTYVVQGVLLSRAGRSAEAQEAIGKAISTTALQAENAVKCQSLAGAGCGGVRFLSWQGDLQGTYVANARLLRQAKRFVMAGFYYEAAQLIPGSIPAEAIGKEAKECAALKATGLDVPK